jgi:multicomponent Na+:H+ antiporter subunit A
MAKHQPGPHPLLAWSMRASAALPLGLFVWISLQLPFFAAGQAKRYAVNWVPSLGVELTLTLDGLSGLFTLIISGVGFLIVLYAGAYMAGHSQLGRFYLFLSGFLISMVGLVLADNLLACFVFWELTTLFSFLLIGFDHESAVARSSARQALLVTGVGGLFLLVGILLIGQVSGSYSLAYLTSSGDLLRRHPLYPAILCCVLVGALTKSAQFPFHFWLPNAMAAPTPISTYLHSATMVKAGIYLLARFHPILGGTLPWMSTLVMVGALTAVWGSILAIAQTDLKRLLAYTTIMALGILTMLLGGTTTPSLTAAMTFLLVHALYKSALFMVVGIIDHQTGSRELASVGGLVRALPLTAAAAVAAGLSMAGFPLFLGFIGKEIMYKGILTEDAFPQLATAAALVANSLMTAVAGVVVLRPFFGKPRCAPAVVEAPAAMWSPPLVLAGTGLFFGLIPDWVVRWLVEPAVLAFHATTEEIQLQLFHGINEPLLLSLLTMSLGAISYLRRRSIRKWVMSLVQHLPVTGEGLYHWGLDTVTWCAKWQTRVLQSGSLYRYVAVIVGAITATMAVVYFSAQGMPDVGFPVGILAYEWILSLLILACIGIIARARSRLLAICGLGIIGTGIAIIFLSYGAPDVALTQLLVETLTVIIAAIVLLRLPPINHPRLKNRFQAYFRLALSLCTGAMITVVLLSVLTQEANPTVTRFYEQASYIEAHGRNIVNVILVDFRSLDTLGEIIVVACAGLAGFALIRKGKPSS